MRVVAIAAVAGAIALAGCEGQAEPAAPPTTEDALTTTTAAPPTTPDEVAVTTEAAPTTEEPPAEEPAEAEGPPEMPAEAMEQTEAGAEAFALHYLTALNATATHPESGILEKLATESCGTCGQFAETVERMAAAGERYDTGLATYRESTAVHTNETAVVAVKVDQPNLSVLDVSDDVVRTYPAESDVDMEFHLVWAEAGWSVDKIFLLEQ